MAFGQNTGNKYAANGGTLTLVETGGSEVAISHLAGFQWNETSAEVEASEQGSDYSDRLIGQKTLELAVTIWKSATAAILVVGSYDLTLVIDDQSTNGDVAGTFGLFSVGIPFVLNQAVAYNARFVNQGTYTITNPVA